MPLENPHDPAAPKTMLHIPTPLIGAAVALVAVLILTYKGFQDSFAYLAVMAFAPVAVYLLSRPAVLFLLVLVVTSAKVWLPMLPMDLPLDIFLRIALLGVVVGSGIITKSRTRRLDPYRVFAYAFIGVILVTMIFRGSGLNQLGSRLWGGKAYLILLVNLFFLLLIPGAITLTRRQWIWGLSIMLLSPLAAVAADTLFTLSGGRFYHLYYLFRPGGEIGSVVFELGEQDSGLWRLKSMSMPKLSWLAMLLLPWLRRKAWGWPVFALLVLTQLGMTALSGYRGAFALIPVYLGVFLLFYFPRRRIRLLAAGALAGALTLGALYALGPRMPAPVQRTLSFLPGLEVDARIRNEAAGSTNWRLDMWHMVMRKEVPRYWLMGRGLAFNPSRLIDRVSVHSDYWHEIHNFITLGAFHNAPLSLLVGFGVWGLLLLPLVLLSAWIRCLRFQRMEWGDSVLRHFHLVFLSLYTAGTAAYILIYGDLDGSLQTLLTFVVIMELLVRSDPRLGATARPAAPAAPVPAPKPAANHVLRHV